MVDPLAEVVTLLQPGATFSKVVSGAGPWRVRRSEAGRPFYCAILEGSCRLAVDGHAPITLQAGDFVLIPSAYGFTMSSLEPPTSEAADTSPVALLHGEFRLGVQSGPPDVLMLVGHCVFGSPDAALLVSLLPQLVHVRGERRLATLVATRGRGIARAAARARCHPGAAAGGSAHRSPPLHDGTCGVAGPLARARRRTPGGRDTTDARKSNPPLDRRATGERGGPVPLRVLRAIQTCGRRRPDGVPAGLAYGSGEDPAASERRRRRRNCGTRGLQLRKHVQRRVHPPCRTAADAVCEGGDGTVTRLARSWALSRLARRPLVIALNPVSAQDLAPPAARSHMNTPVLSRESGNPGFFFTGGAGQGIPTNGSVWPGRPCAPIHL